MIKLSFINNHSIRTFIVIWQSYDIIWYYHQCLKGKDWEWKDVFITSRGVYNAQIKFYQISQKCEIWGSHSGEDDNDVLLGCDALKMTSRKKNVIRVWWDRYVEIIHLMLNKVY
jgi:hypothetical protein